MKKLLELLAGKEPAPDGLSDYWKKAATSTMVFFCFIAFSGMLITNILTGEKVYFWYLNSLGILLTIICLVLLRVTGKQRLFSIFFISFIFIASVFVFVEIEAPRFEHLVPCMLPMVCIFLYDRKFGIVIPIAYYVIILVIQIIIGPFTTKYFIQYSLYYFALTFFPYLTAYTRRRTQKILEETEKEKAIFDSQTMLYSKAYIVRLVEEGVVSEPFSLMMIDIDNFKNVNDTRGHIFGDECINAVAETLKTVVKNGFCGRFGGDEFIIIKPCEKRMDVKADMAKIHREINDDIAHLGITVSGGTVVNVIHDKPARLIYNADTALYRAKAEGKACVRFYQDAEKAVKNDK